MRLPDAPQAVAPLRHRCFRLLFSGRVVSFAASAMAPIALAFAVLGLGGSATDLGLVLILALIPRLLLILIGGEVAAMLAQLAVPAVRKLPRAEPLPSPS